MADSSEASASPVVSPVAMKSDNEVPRAPLGGEASSKAPAPPPATGYETNPVVVMLDAWRDFRKSTTFKWLSLQNPRESALPLAAAIVGLLVLTFFSPLELALVCTFFGIMAGGVLTLVRRFAPQLDVPEPRTLVASAVSREKLQAGVEDFAAFLSSHVGSATYVLAWEDSLFSVRVAAVAWLCYRWSFLLAPATALGIVLAAVGTCAAIHHVVRNTTPIEEALRQKAAPLARQFLNRAAQGAEKVQAMSKDNAPIVLGVGVAVTAFTLFTFRHFFPILTSVSLVAFAILLHWAVDSTRPKSE